MQLKSKLPTVGTTIFTTISALAIKHSAVNLGQGFPDFECDKELLQNVTNAMNNGKNQYAPMAGVHALREAISKKVLALYGKEYDIENEITVTAGATQGILSAVLAVVNSGDEVIVLEPCYDSYVPNIELADGIVVRVALDSKFKPDFMAIKNAITKKTRAIIINTPHNPTASTWDESDFMELEKIVNGTDIIVISDEVYEHMVYDNKAHQSIAKFKNLSERAFIISSFGKTYHVTGWKIGYVCAPKYLMDEFRKVHQFNVFSVNTPMQYALAQYMQKTEPYLELSNFYEKKRDLFRENLNKKFEILDCSGTYFQCVNYSQISDMSGFEFCEYLIKDVGVAAIPLSFFYGDGRDNKIIRFCFAKKDETIYNALEKLSKL